jgi:hypothetical protein
MFPPQVTAVFYAVFAMLSEGGNNYSITLLL